MKIKSIDIQGFGVWSGLSIQHLSDGLTVFFGPNEAGKTTLMQFVRSVLYGYNHERQSYLPPFYGGRPGGHLDLQADSGQFRVARHLEAGIDSLQIVGGGGMRQGGHMLKSLLSDVEESVFNHVFCIGLHDIQRLNVLNETEVAAMLYELSVGLGGVSMVQVMQGLNQHRESLLDRDGGPSTIVDLIELRQTAEQEFQASTRQTRQYERLVTGLRQLDRKIAHSQQLFTQWQQKASKLDAAVRIRHTWQQRDEVADSIRALGDVKPVPGGVLKKLDELNQQIDQIRGEMTGLQKQQSELKQQHRRVEAEIDEGLPEWGPEIRGLSNRAERYTRFEIRHQQLNEELKKIEDRMGSNRGEFGSGIDSEVSSKLRQLGYVLEERTKGLKEAKIRFENNHKVYTTFNERLAHELEKLGTTNRIEELSSLDKQIGDLEKHLGNERNVSSLEKKRDHLEADWKRLRRHPNLSLPVDAFIYLLFVSGSVIIASRLFQLITIDYAGLFGGALVVAAVWLKIYLSNRVKLRIEKAEADLKACKEEIERKKEDLLKLNVPLSMTGDTHKDHLFKLREKQQALKELEKVELQCDKARRQTEEAERQVKDLELAKEQAELRWKSALQNAGLPDRLMPSDLNHVISQTNEREELQRRHDLLRDELELVTTEIDDFRRMVRNVQSETNIDAPGSDPVKILQALRDELALQNEKRKRRRELKDAWQRLSKSMAQKRQEQKQLRRRRFQTLKQVDARSEEELLERKERFEQCSYLEDQREAAQHEIDTVLEGVCTEDELAEYLKPGNVGQLKAMRDEAAENFKATQTKLQEMSQEKGRQQADLEQIRQDRSLARKSLELATLKQQTRNAVHDWRVQAVAARVLDSIHNTYEAENQPETLIAASKYLYRITGGHYQRIWTPMDENSLRVDDYARKSYTPENLSQGTREQLYLALRLGLVEMYAGRGTRLPLILDDVLVNCDKQRVEAAATTLRSFVNEGHQALLFTCHEHIARQMQAAGADIRQLPQNRRAIHFSNTMRPNRSDDDQATFQESPLRSSTTTNVAPVETKPQPKPRKQQSQAPVAAPQPIVVTPQVHITNQLPERHTLTPPPTDREANSQAVDIANTHHEKLSTADNSQAAPTGSDPQLVAPDHDPPLDLFAPETKKPAQDRCSDDQDEDDQSYQPVHDHAPDQPDPYYESDYNPDHEPDDDPDDTDDQQEPVDNLPDDDTPEQPEDDASQEMPQAAPLPLEPTGEPSLDSFYRRHDDWYDDLIEEVHFNPYAAEETPREEIRNVSDMVGLGGETSHAHSTFWQDEDDLLDLSRTSAAEQSSDHQPPDDNDGDGDTSNNDEYEYAYPDEASEGTPSDAYDESADQDYQETDETAKNDDQDSTDDYEYDDEALDESEDDSEYEYETYSEDDYTDDDLAISDQNIEDVEESDADEPYDDDQYDDEDDAPGEEEEEEIEEDDENQRYVDWDEEDEK